MEPRIVSNDQTLTLGEVLNEIRSAKWALETKPVRGKAKRKEVEAQIAVADNLMSRYLDIAANKEY